MSRRDLRIWGNKLEKRDISDPYVKLAMEIIYSKPPVPPIEAEFRRKLYLDLMKNHPANRRTNTIRNFKRVMFATVSMLIFFCFLFLSPHLYSLAQDIIRQIGDLSISNEPTSAEQTVENGASHHIGSTPFSGDGTDLSGLLTIEEATAKAGFPVYSPDCSLEGYVCTNRAVVSGNDSAAVITVLVKLASNAEVGNLEEDPIDDIVFISQYVYKTAPEPLRLGEAPIQDVLIRGHEGVWVENSALGQRFGISDPDGDAGSVELVYENLLIWEEDSCVFMIRSPNLTFSDALMIANSMSASINEH